MAENENAAAVEEEDQGWSKVTDAIGTLVLDGLKSNDLLKLTAETVLELGETNDRFLDDEDVSDEDFRALLGTQNAMFQVMSVTIVGHLVQSAEIVGDTKAILQAFAEEKADDAG